jgi:predicted GNAT family acetyltransferase
MEEIQHHQDGNRGNFYITKDHKKLAELTYRFHNARTIIIEHTMVDISMQGKGIGKCLLEKCVLWARSSGIKIIPQCAFAISVFDADKSFQDVLA